MSYKVFEVLKEMRNEIKSVHCRMERVESHLEEFYKLFSSLAQSMPSSNVQMSSSSMTSTPATMHTKETQKLMVPTANNPSLLSPYDSWNLRGKSSKLVPPLSAQCSPATDDSAIHDCDKGSTSRLAYAGSAASASAYSPFFESASVMTDSAVSLRCSEPLDASQKQIQTPVASLHEQPAAIRSHQVDAQTSQRSKGHQHRYQPHGRLSDNLLPSLPQSGFSDASSSESSSRKSRRPSSLAVTPKSQGSDHASYQCTVGSDKSYETSNSSSASGAGQTFTIPTVMVNLPSSEESAKDRPPEFVSMPPTSTSELSPITPTDKLGPQLPFMFDSKQLRLKSKKHNIDRFPFIDDSIGNNGSNGNKMSILPITSTLTANVLYPCSTTSSDKSSPVPKGNAFAASQPTSLLSERSCPSPDLSSYPLLTSLDKNLQEQQSKLVGDSERRRLLKSKTFGYR